MAAVSPTGDYQLLDFGLGRKLERFGGLVLDRPSPAAEGQRPATPALWRSADARFAAEGDSAEGWVTGSAATTWSIEQMGLTLELKLTPFGHVGLFPEHEAVWRELVDLCRGREGLSVLNLFAYTGAASLAAAAAGARVTHVDAADNVVRWARRNAELSGLQDRPIRWIVDDARQFVAREIRRGRRYDVVLLDPPAFGHGPGRQRWSIDQDLEPLLGACRQLLESGGRLAISSHSRGYDAHRLRSLAAECTGSPAQVTELALATSDGRSLPLGAVAWSAKS